MSDMKQFRLPDVGEGLTEADIVTWHVKPGDKVTVNQVIVEIETAKALVELPCPYEGVVNRLLVDEGQTVDVGTPIIEVDAGGSAPAGAAATAPAAAPVAAPPAPVAAPSQGAVEPGIVGSPAPKAERQAVLVGYGVKPGTTARRPRWPATGAARGGRRPAPVPVPNGLAAGNGSAPPAPAPGPLPTARPVAKPPVRKLARDLGVDLGAVAGSGPGGLITRDDVQTAALAPGGPTAPTHPVTPAGAGIRETRVPVKGVRRHTAAAVAASAFTAPHVTEFLQVDVTESMRALERIAALPEFGSLRPSPLLLAARALLVAVARHPMINSSWDEDTQEIAVKHYVNLGIAAATERGLLVPNIKDAQTLSLPALAGALADLAATARSGRTPPADLTGGTITITNVGVFGVDGGTPILTPGEAAILALGQVRDAPWVHEGELAVRAVTTLSLSFDHRIVDGDLGSAVLRDVGAMLTDPARILAWS